MANTTLFEFMGEINTYAHIDESVMIKAKESPITEKNNKNLKKLISDWTRGVYDEDPMILANELSYLLN